MGRALDTVKHPTTYRAAPTTKMIQSKMSAVPLLRNLVLADEHRVQGPSLFLLFDPRRVVNTARSDMVAEQMKEGTNA